MTKRKLIFAVLLLSAVSFAQGSFNGGTIAGNFLPDTTGRNLGSSVQQWNAFIRNMTIYGTATATTLTVPNINGVLFASTGPDACANIAAQIAALPATGGMVFAPPPGSQTCSSNPFAGNTKPVTLVLSPGSTYVSTKTWLITSSNTYIIGNGATIEFEPVAPFVTNVNDRAVAFDWAEPTSPAARNITGAIAIGDTSFTATAAGDVTGIVPGDWLHIYEYDSGVGDVWLFDWVQVASVAGTTANVVRPFRMAFPNTHSGTKFMRLTVPPVENVGISGTTIKSDEASDGKPGIAVLRVRNAKVKDNVVNNARGQSLYSYRSQGATFEGNKVLARATQSVTSEFAESVDLTVCNNRWEGEAVSTPPAGFSDVIFDYGAGFFKFCNNAILSNGYPLSLVYGVHDGLVTGNTFPNYVGSANRIGITLMGALRNTISNNVLNGGSGSSIGIQLTSGTSMSPSVTTAGNVVSGNTVLNYATPYRGFGTTDQLLGGGSLTYVQLMTHTANGSWIYCSDCVEAAVAAGSGLGALAKRENGVWVTSFRSGVSFTAPNIGAATTALQVTSTLATGTAPLVIASTTPVANLAATPTTYDPSGTQITGTHIVRGVCTLGSSCVVTLSGAAAFSDTAYQCACADQTSAAACKIVNTAARTITITGTGTDVISFVCVGR